MAKGNRLSRIGRLAGACAVVGALLAGPLAAAGNAAATPDLKSFAGQGTGFALRVVVDLSGLPAAAKTAVDSAYGTFRTALPVAQQALLPAKFPFVIDQRFIETLSELGATSQAHSLLGQGVIQDVVGKVIPTNFNQSANATTTGKSDSVSTATKNLPSDQLPLINASVGKLNAAISSVPRVTSDGSLASVSASLQQLFSAIPGLPAELTAALNQLQTQLQGAVNTAYATGPLSTALSTVGTTLASTPVGSPLAGVLTQAGLGGTALGNPTTMIQKLQDPNLVQVPQVSNLLRGVAATVNGLTNTAAAEKSSGKAFSDATSKLASIDLLGLLHVGVVNLNSHSEAAGKAGSAHNSSSCSLTAVRLGAAGVSLDGKTLIVGGVPVPVPAVDIGIVKNAVNSVLSAAGLSVGLCDVANGKTAADGTSASQTVSALRIQFAPTLLSAANGINGTNDPLGLIGSQPVKIVIDPSVETAASAQVAPAAGVAALPHTGAAPLATIVTGMIVAAGALILRRRLA